MQDRLKLTPAQVTQLETIMHETKAKTRAVRDSYQPQMLKIKQDHIERVKAILTPEQIPAYEKLVAEREQRSREQDERDRNDELTNSCSKPCFAAWLVALAKLLHKLPPLIKF